jgi:hypothetical protein
MAVSRSEIEERWLGHPLQDSEAGSILECFNRVEQMLGRPWLEASVQPGVVGPSQLLPIYRLGDQLSVLARATGAEKLIRRLQAREPASFSELHSIALCVDGTDAEIEIEPLAPVGDSGKVPDFRIRRPTEEWVWVEVTQPSYSESAQIAQSAAASLRDLLTDIPDGMEVQIRFRCEPSDADFTSVRTEAGRAGLDETIDRPNFVIHTRAAKPVLTPIGSDEHGRPIFGKWLFRVNGENRASLSMRVPYTDLRGQQVIDAEARQLPKEGPGLICIATGHGKYWRSLIERSFSPTIRRRISGVLLFESGVVIGDHGIELRTAGRLLSNPHARQPLPSWLETSFDRLPGALVTAGAPDATGTNGLDP